MLTQNGVELFCQEDILFSKSRSVQKIIIGNFVLEGAGNVVCSPSHDCSGSSNTHVLRAHLTTGKAVFFVFYRFLPKPCLEFLGNGVQKIRAR